MMSHADCAWCLESFCPSLPILRSHAPLHPASEDWQGIADALRDRGILAADLTDADGDYMAQLVRTDEYVQAFEYFSPDGETIRKRDLAERLPGLIACTIDQLFSEATDGAEMDHAELLAVLAQYPPAPWPEG